MASNIFVITGPSGFQKGKLIDFAISKNNNLIRSVSYTDRPKRVDEIDGQEFKFISEKEFTSMINGEKFIEWQRLLSNNYRYGKSKHEFAELVRNNPDKVILTIVNIINLPVFKRYYPEAKSIFIDVKDTNFLIEYLRNSPDVNTEEEFLRRFKFATEERRRRHLADYSMHTTENIEDSVDEFLSLIKKEFGK